MTGAHPHSGPVELFLAVAALPAAAGYLGAAARLRRRGDAWHPARDVSFAAGCAGLLWASSGMLPGGPFTAHMTGHLVTGMAAPLLLVLARPVTLLLRALSPGPARRALLAVVRSRAAALLVSPPVAALLSVVGLWLLYRTGLFAATRHEPLAHAVVHAHVLAAGLLFTFAVCQLDPVRHRRGTTVRGAVLLAAGAAHAVLAKGLYAAPPPGTAFAIADLRTAAQLMYYGGDLVELALAGTLAVQWYTATGRARARRAPPAPIGPAPRRT